MLTAADDQRGELPVVQETDPALPIGYRLTGLRDSDGTTVVSDPSNGALPFSLAVGGRADGDDWAVGAVDTAIDAGRHHQRRPGQAGQPRDRQDPVVADAGRDQRRLAHPGRR